MSAGRTVVIVGASARAAAFSALRAGLAPWCADLFADADLAARCPVTALPFNQYPHGFSKILQQAPPGPWMFTGGLENRPRLIERISRDRPLWGCPPEALRSVRDPANLACVFARSGIPFPGVRLAEPDSADGRRWLVKPRDGAAGSGIAEYRSGRPIRKRTYYQEFIEGLSTSAVYVGRPGGAELLGVTRQLVGEPWLNAQPFQYCGSITLDATPEPGFQIIGDALAREFELLGLFGVDCIMRDGAPWPVEVNPRYTASVEVVEWATGRAALAEHAGVFSGQTGSLRRPSPIGPFVGKAVLFAARTIAFPTDGPWSRQSGDPPRFADIPRAGSRIDAGWPVMSLFAVAHTAVECIETMKQIAADIERRLQCGR